MAIAAIVVAAWACAGLGARATYGAQVTADEPQYLLSAISLAEDLDLDIADELDGERWRAFHESLLPEQTEPLADGRRLSPHDPLLPLLLAVPVALGGWVGAKLFLASVAGALAAAITWVAHRRFSVRPQLAAGVVIAFGVTPPLTAYATQVYPEVLAALAVTVAVGALLGELDRRGRVVLAVAVIALPWLAVKYVPVAVALAGAGLVLIARRADGRAARDHAAALALAALVYLAGHRMLYGGWTAYAVGDHFTGGELTAIGHAPNYVGRSRRVLGLLVDRGFGLAAWAPAYLLAVPAVAALARRRAASARVLAVPLAAGWATATWIALTMHGWWWPGRQTVVVLPIAVLAVAWWCSHLALARRALAASSAVAAFCWLWLVIEVHFHHHVLIVDFEETTNPLVRAWRPVLPDLLHPTATTPVLVLAWFVVLAVLAAAGWRSAAPTPIPPTERTLTDVHA
jgi:hypothetical protein